MTRFSSWLAGALLVAVGAGAYGCYQQHQLNQRLQAQLQQLAQALNDENIQANEEANRLLKRTEASVIKNQKQPHQVAGLDTCRALRNRTRALLATLQSHRRRLLVATGNRDGSLITRPDEAGTVSALIGAGTPLNRTLRQRLATYLAALHRLSPTDTLQIHLPSFQDLPLTAALVALATIENDVLHSEMLVQRHLARPLGPVRLWGQLLAMATAESNMVAPGDTYRAKMFLVKKLYFKNLTMHMQANNQSVPIDSDGFGRVRFTAPKKPGSYVWNGLVRFNQNGRDTTFQARVPCRVARPL